MRIYVDEGASVQLDRQRTARGPGTYDLSGLSEGDRARVLDHEAVHVLADGELPPPGDETSDLEERVTAVEEILDHVQTGLEELWARVGGGSPAEDSGQGEGGEDGPPEETEDGASDDGDGEEDEEPIDATDAARELAGEHGIELAKIEGTGEDGRVLKSDVQAAVAEAED